MVTVDCVVFGLDERDLKVLLIQRGVDPFKSRWALPGGFVRMDDGGRAKTEQHIVAAMGLDDGTTNLRDVFRKMGIEDR
ncbi:MAG: NUDIX domain-containing protein, partial [Myxococcales bacterium]